MEAVSLITISFAAQKLFSVMKFQLFTKKAVVYSYNRVLLSDKERQTHAICGNTDGAGRSNSTLNKSEGKR